METELKCPVCMQFFTNPVLLPCSHSVCSSCVKPLTRRRSVMTSQLSIAPVGIAMLTVDDDEDGEAAEESSDTVSIRSRSSTHSSSSSGGGGQTGDGKAKLVSSSSSTSLSTVQPPARRPPPAPPQRRASASIVGSQHGLEDLRLYQQPGNLKQTTETCGLSDCSSIASETDSGVVCSGNCSSRKLQKSTSLSISVGNLSNTGRCEPAMAAKYELECPICRYVKPILGNSSDALSYLPRNTALAVIVLKYTAAKSEQSTECQLCEADSCRPAVVVCVQCNVAYCEQCRERCHPLRGPLASHQLVTSAEAIASTLREKCAVEVVSKCGEHPEEVLSTYCMLCNSPVCCVCTQYGRHVSHTVQPIGALCRARKEELTQSLQRLSEKAWRGSEFLHSLKLMKEDIQANAVEFEASLVAQLDTVMHALEVKRQQLLQRVSDERLRKEQAFTEQISDFTSNMQRTTAVLQLCVEMLKEPDPLAFLLVSSGLLRRVVSTNSNFEQEMVMEPREPATFDFQVRSDRAIESIQAMNLCELKVPGVPEVRIEDCQSRLNTLSMSWRPSGPVSAVDGYSVEIAENDFNGFREVYRGSETLCTIDNLEFGTTYAVRVRAFGMAGYSKYSTAIRIQTSDVATFSLNPTTANADIVLTNNYMTATCGRQCCNTDYRVVCGNVGLSTGTHYWQFVIDRMDNNCDLAFGVAVQGVATDRVLGKDGKAWSMYIDQNRSWCLHGGSHSGRMEGGIAAGSIVGVLLDVPHHVVSFFVDGRPRGGVTIAANDVAGKVLLFPAVSVNCNATVTLQSGLKISSLHGLCDDD